MKKQGGASSPQLFIMLDTNVLYADGSGDDFFSPVIARVITDEKYAPLNINWTIPRMVRLEREYHLRQKAKHIVTKAREMPSLFASTWVGDPDAVNAAISEHAQRELDRLKVTERECKPDQIDWNTLMHSAGLRLPPFDPDERGEKGFKDAIVAESFIQFCGELPAWGAGWAILVSNDAILKAHVESRLSAPRFRVLPTTNALVSELNFLLTDIGPEQAATLLALAERLINGDPDFWSNVLSIASYEIQSSQSTQIFGVGDVTVHQAHYGPNVFLGKQLRKVHFSFRLDFPRSGKAWVPDPLPPNSGLFGLGGNALATHRLSDLANPGAAPGVAWSSLSQPSSAGASGLPAVASTSPLRPFLSDPPWSNGTAIPLSAIANSASLPGHFEEVQLAPLYFEVHWNADYEVKKDGEDEVPSIGRPFIEKVSLL